MQCSEIEHQLVIRSTIDLTTRLDSSLGPTLPLRMGDRLTTVLHGPRHTAPDAERYQRERIAHIEEALKQQLIDPERRHSGPARGGHAIAQLLLVTGCRRDRDADECQSLRIEAHSNTPHATRRTHFTARVPHLHASPPPPRPASS